jgi:hypothetical protein
MSTILTEERAQELVTRLLGTTSPPTMRPIEFGWMIWEPLTPRETSQGMYLGQGSYIVDQTSVVTVHSSLPPNLVIAQYNEARRQGRFTGRQVYPKTWTVSARLIGEDRSEVEYTVHATSLTTPPQPDHTTLLTLNKTTHRPSTFSSTIHETAVRATARLTSFHDRTKSWPTEVEFEV